MCDGDKVYQRIEEIFLTLPKKIIINEWKVFPVLIFVLIRIYNTSMYIDKYVSIYPVDYEV